MDNKLFIAGLSWGLGDADLESAFAAAGEVVSAKVIMDRETGRSRGFGFVEMASGEEAQKAIELLNEKELDGRTIHVSIARPRD